MQPTPDDAVAAQVAAGVSLSYNAPQFFILRASILYGQPVDAQELVALEAGVQKAVSKLQSRVEALQQELEAERELQAQQHAAASRVQADLEVQLAVSRASEKALQQLLDKARGDVSVLRQQLGDSQLMVSESQHALTLNTDTLRDLRGQLDGLKQQLKDRHTAESINQRHQQQQQHKTQQQQQQAQEATLQQQQESPAQQQHRQLEQKQLAEAPATTPGTCKGQADEQQTDLSTDTKRQQDQQQQQEDTQLAHTDQQQSPAALLQQAAAGVRQLPSPLLSPTPTVKRSGHDSPLTPQRRSRIPAAPEAPGSSQPHSYLAALRRSREGAAASASSAGGSQKPSPGVGSRPSVFKFTACPAPSAVVSSCQQVFNTGVKPRVAGAGTGSRFGSSVTGSTSNRRRVVRSAQSSRQQQVPPRQPQSASAAGAGGSKQKGCVEAEASSDSAAEARKRRWR